MSTISLPILTREAQMPSPDTGYPPPQPLHTHSVVHNLTIFWETRLKWSQYGNWEQRLPRKFQLLLFLSWLLQRWELEMLRGRWLWAPTVREGGGSRFPQNGSFPCECTLWAFRFRKVPRSSFGSIPHTFFSLSLRFLKAQRGWRRACRR